MAIYRARDEGARPRLRRALPALSLGLAVALVATGCGEDSSPSDGSHANQPADDALRIGLIKLQDDPYYQAFQHELEREVQADGGSVVNGQSNNDPATEAQVAQKMIDGNVDAVLMQPAASEGSVTTMRSIRDAGIPLICFGNCLDQTTDPSLVQGVIQSDNTSLGSDTGKIAAKFIKAQLGGTAKIAILNCDVASGCRLRKAGFKQALADTGIRATYVTDQEAYLDEPSLAVTTEILKAHADLDLIWAANDGGTTGATTAVQRQGAKVPVFGTDISVTLAQMLLNDDDILQATTGQDPAQTAQGAYAMATKALADKPNNPFSVELPGIVYNRQDPEKVREFLGSARQTP